MEEIRRLAKSNADEIILARKDTLDQSIKSFKQNSETQMVLGSVKNDTHAIKNKMGLYFGIMIAGSFVLGVMIGTQYKVWSPFASELYNTYRVVKGATR